MKSEILITNFQLLTLRDERNLKRNIELTIRTVRNKYYGLSFVTNFCLF